MKKFYLIAVFFALWATTLFAEEHTILQDAIGCQSREYFEKILEFIAQKDDFAANYMINFALKNGQCSRFLAQEKIFIMDKALLAGLIKIRRKGHLIEFWTYLECLHPPKKR